MNINKSLLKQIKIFFRHKKISFLPKNNKKRILLPSWENMGVPRM